MDIEAGQRGSISDARSSVHLLLDPSNNRIGVSSAVSLKDTGFRPDEHCRCRGHLCLPRFDLYGEAAEIKIIPISLDFGRW